MSNTPGPVRLTGPLAALAAIAVAILTAPFASATTPQARTMLTQEASVQTSVAAKRHHDEKASGTDCMLRVPAAPTTAAGLATPYQLTGGGCHEANPDTAAFVEATIVNPATGALSVYRPLVIDADTVPAAPPTPVTLPAGAVVGVWFGFQGDALTLNGPGANTCVNGVKGSPFGQFAYCNAPAFFTAAMDVPTPALGTGADGLPCPTVRDFGVVDQDQSDNVVTTYRVTADGRVAQNAAANAGIGTVIKNASDNGLLDRAIDPALGCRPFTAPDLTNGGALVPSLALNELHAAARQADPVALVPPNDPMAQVKGQTSTAKTRLYRVGVGQSPVIAADAAATYCQNLAATAPARLATDKDLFAAAPSPDPAMNLYDFLNGRLTASLQLLGCPA